MLARRCPLANGALCLSTPKYNGKSVTEYKENNGRDVLDNNVDIKFNNLHQNVLFLTIARDKSVIYVLIRRYGDCNTLQ